jgi:hypothetical protein
MAPRRDRYRLGRESLDLSTARRWFRHWTVSRHRDGADRTLVTFLGGGCSAAEATDVIFSAITDRFYADGGHTFDFANKAFEIAERIGWEDASQLLPALVPGTVGARGAEESSPWRSPIDLVALVQENVSRLADASNAGMNKRWAAEVELADTILGDDPHATVDALVQAVADGACPDQLGAALALAAAIRIARFGSANELGDWDTALHTFTYANAVHQALLRCPSIEILRGVFHGAMSCYLDRYLNVPPAHVPAEGELFSDLPQEPLPLLENLLDVCNRQQQAQAATRIVAQYTALGLPSSSLLTTLAQAVLREDAAFHTFQLLEAGLRQFRHWEGTPQARLILIAMARYIAAHAPTQRGFLQTFDIARRLHRGETLYE